MVHTQADPGAAMQAVLRHLEAKDPGAAEAVMAAITDPDLCTLDTPPLWAPFRAAGFVYGLTRLESFFAAYATRNVGLRLWAVQWRIERGEADAAIAELADLLQMDEAAPNIMHALHCYLQLGRLDLAAEAVAIVAARPHGSAADQVRLGFEVAGFLQGHNLRGALSRHLHRLGPLCAGDLRLTMQLADAYLAIDEKSFALDAFKLLPEPEASSPMSKLYHVQLSPERHRPFRRDELQPLRRETTTDWEFWNKLSHAAENVDDVPLALEAARKALDNGPADPVWLRIRMAQILATSGHHREAVVELEALLPDETAMKFAAQIVGDSAVACGRPDLAVAACERWLGIVPEDVQAHVMYCVYTRHAGDAAKRHDAASLAMETIRGGRPLTRHQFGLLIDGIGGVNRVWETELAQAAARQHPQDEEFAALARPDSFAARFRGPQAVSPPGAEAKRVTGWLSRLGFGRAQ